PGDLESGPTQEIALSYNHLLGNSLGIHSRNTMGIDGGRIRVVSVGNLFEDNYYGWEATAGVDLGWPSGPNGNRYDIDSLADSFINNYIGLLAVGTERDNPGSTAHAGNQLNVAMIGPRFSGYPHVPGSAAAHVWPFFGSPMAGDVNNRVNFLM